jgi:hypothetical protein
MEIPACLLARAGIGTDQAWKADAVDGEIVIRALPGSEAEAEDGITDSLPDDIPEMARLALAEAGVCLPRLREILCEDVPIPF